MKNYAKEIEEMKHMSKQEFIASLRRYTISNGHDIYIYILILVLVIANISKVHSVSINLHNFTGKAVVFREELPYLEE